MSDIKKIIRHLEELGFRITSNDGTRRKIYPPDKTKPFYSAHLGQGAIYPLIQFAKRNWGIDLYDI